MPLEIYLAFVLASVLIIIIPGPTNLVVVSAALESGLRGSAWTVYGGGLAHLLLCIGATLGLAAVMAMSSEVFEVIRWLGVAYLLGLGLVHWARRPGATKTGNGNAGSRLGLFAQGFVVTITNPKGLLFYGAFFPPFVDAAKPVLPQLSILTLTHVTLFLVLAFAHAITADRIRMLLVGSRFQRIRNRISGGLFVTAGALLSVSGMESRRS